MERVRPRWSYLIATVEDALQATEDAFTSGIAAVGAARSAVRQIEDWGIALSGKMANVHSPAPTVESAEAVGVREAVELLTEWLRQDKQSR